MRDVGRGAPRPAPGAFVAFAVIAGAALAFAIAAEPRLVHWFLIPTCALAAVLGFDALRWLRGQIPPFHPRGMLAVLGLHLFVVAPVLIVYWDAPFDIAKAPPDWRPWLGQLAVLNLCGYLVVRHIVGLFARPGARARVTWQIDPRRITSFLLPALVASGLAQAYVWYLLGGISGQIDAFRGVTPTLPAGIYKWQVLASAFPVLLLIAITSARLRARGPAKLSKGLLALVIVFALYLVIDGLRGSRSAIVWTMFWAAGVLHYFWRPVRARTMVLAVIPLLAFMYLYGFYKAYGPQLMDRLAESDGLGELSEKTGRTFDRVLIADLSRADIQAFLLYRASESRRWEPAGGATYVDAITRLAPIPGRRAVPMKATVAAELIYGHQAGQFYTVSKVYGLTGEAVLNFGAWGVIPAFFVFALVLGAMTRWIDGLPEHDARLFLVPLATVVAITLLIGDLDNLMTLMLNKIIVPTGIVWALSRRVATRHEAGAPQGGDGWARTTRAGTP